jgi:peroxiredoxin
MSPASNTIRLQPMETSPHPQPPRPAARPRTGLAIACLVLGIVAVFASILVVGAFAGLLAILLGAIHIFKRRGPNGMAWTGIGLSLLGIVLSVGLAALYFKAWEAARGGWSNRAESESAVGVESTEEFGEWVGREVPDFTVTSLNGERLRLGDLRGRRVVLDFWATWCPPCRREIPHFVRLSDENPREALLIIGISSEDEKTLAEFVEKEGVNYPIVSTDDLPPPFDAILSIPTTFFVDRNGIIQEVVVGYHDYEHLKKLALAEDVPLKVDAASEAQP